MTTTACRRLVPAFAALLLTLLPGLLLETPLAAQKSATEARVTPTPEAIAKVVALMARHPEHDILGQLAGSWEGTIQAAVRSSPDEVPTAVSMNIRWMLDRYFLESDDSIQIQGTPAVRSRSAYGYNTLKKYFYRTELQGGDPREYLSTGTWDEATRTFTFIGPEHSPVTGDDFQRRDTFRLVGEDQLAFERSFLFQDKSEIRAFHGTLRKKTDAH
jgi:hypothetical protein